MMNMRRTIPDSIDSIGAYVFGGCSALETVSIPDSVTFIGRSAFQNSGLVEIDIPSGVTEIEGYAFGGDDLTVTAAGEPASYGFEPYAGVEWEISAEY